MLTWFSCIAQSAKNLPAMQETWVRFLGQEDPLEKEYSRILAWRIPMDRGAWRATVHGVTKSWIRLSNYTVIHLMKNPERTFWSTQYMHTLGCMSMYMIIMKSITKWAGKTIPEERLGGRSKPASRGVFVHCILLASSVLVEILPTSLLPYLHTQTGTSHSWDFGKTNKQPTQAHFASASHSVTWVQSF